VANVDEALSAQLRDRLTNGWEADTELGGEQPHRRDALSGPNVAGQDPQPDEARRPNGQRLAFEYRFA
jgi:hypothetical protein